MNQSLATVSSIAHWRVAPVPRSTDTERWSALTVPEVITMTCGDGSKLYLKAMQQFTYGDHPKHDGDRKVNTREYAYTLTDDPDFEIARLAWEWNPASEVWADPHVHVGRGDPQGKGFHKFHIPTGRVAFEHVLKFAIQHHGVRTTGGPTDALAMLDSTLVRFNNHKTW